MAFRNVELVSGLDALGTLIASEITFVAQDEAVYGTPDMLSTVSANSGSASGSASNNFITVSSSTNALGFCQAFDKRYLHYGSGQAAHGIASVLFTAPTANAIQYVGVFSAECGVLFGCNGLTPGVFHRTGGRQAVYTLTIITASSAISTITVTLDGVATNITSANDGGVKAITARTIAAASYAGWTATQSGDTVVFISNQCGIRSGAFTYAAGASGSAASFAATQAGVAYVLDDFVALTSVNGDKLDGTGSSRIDYNPEMLIVIYIQYAYLGTAPPAIWILGDDGRFHLVHRFPYVNANTAVNLSQPSMHVGWGVEKAAGASDILVKGASLALGSSGPAKVGGNDGAVATGSASSTSELPLMSIRLKPVKGNRPNRNIFRITKMRVSTASNGSNIIRWYLNATVTGQQWVDNTSSIPSDLQISTTGTAISAIGVPVGGGVFQNSGNVEDDYQEDPLLLRAGDVLTCTIQNGNAAASARSAFVRGFMT